MIQYGRTKRNDIQIEFVKEDVDGFKVEGDARYDKDRKLVDVSANIFNADGVRVTRFSMRSGLRDSNRINLLGCMQEYTEIAMVVAKATIDELARTYPEK